MAQNNFGLSTRLLSVLYDNGKTAITAGTDSAGNNNVYFYDATGELEAYVASGLHRFDVNFNLYVAQGEVILDSTGNVKFFGQLYDLNNSYAVYDGSGLFCQAGLTVGGVQRIDGSGNASFSSVISGAGYSMNAGGSNGLFMSLLPLIDNGGNSVYNNQATPNGRKIKGGVANSRYGEFTLNGAALVTVANTSITANSRIVWGVKTVSGTPSGIVKVNAINVGVNFQVFSIAADSSTYWYEIFEMN